MRATTSQPRNLLSMARLNNARSRVRCSIWSLAIEHDQSVIDLLEATLVAELGKPAIDGAPRRQIARQQTPRTARPHHIEDAVDDLAHWPSPWSTRAISRWQVRLDHTPFLISHVRLVSVGLANMLLSGGWGPHGNSGVGVRTPWNHVDSSNSTSFETASEKMFGLKPKHLAADTAYGTGKFLAWIVGIGITPHIPVRDFSQRDGGTFSRSDFKFDKDRNIYVCPAGKLLKTMGRILLGYVLRYTASTYDCGPCPFKSKCCPNTPQCIVPRDVNEDARDHARALDGTPAFQKSSNQRKKVEMHFAHLKTQHRFERMRLRGLSGARDEFHLAAIVQNLKTLANHIWRPPPDAMVVCPA